MDDAPDDIVLAYLQRIDEKVDRLAEDVQDLKQRMTSVERQLGEMRTGLAGAPARLDNLGARIIRTRASWGRG